MNDRQDNPADKRVAPPVPLDYKRYESPAGSYRLGKSLGSIAGALLVFFVGAVVFLVHMFEEHKHSYLPSIVFGFLVAAGVYYLVEGICFLAG